MLYIVSANNTSNFTLLPNTWYHLVFTTINTSTGSDSSIYINGALDKSFSLTTKLNFIMIVSIMHMKLFFHSARFFFLFPPITSLESFEFSYSPGPGTSPLTHIPLRSGALKVEVPAVQKTLG